MHKEDFKWSIPLIDKIPAELRKVAGEEGTKIVSILSKKIWKTCEWPIDWKRLLYMPLPKKEDIRECSNHRTIALTFHASKV